MKHVIIGTAGHVDHGKTTLIKALTGTDTDRLKEEQERGMTIDLGFAALTLPDGTKAGIVDVPGHERFLKNMLAGAGGVDVVLLVIAADESVMPQTVEHLDILRLLDVKNGVVALTKADMVDPDWLEIVVDDVRGHLKDSFLAESPIVPVDSLSGRGINELKKELFAAVARAEAKNAAIPFRLPVDRVFTRPGFGTVVTGTLVSGTMRVGDGVEVLPKRIQTRIRGLQSHGKKQDAVEAGTRVAVNLAGVEVEELERGAVLSPSQSMAPTQAMDAVLRLLPSAPRALSNRTRVRVYIGTAEILGRMQILGQEQLEPGKTGYVQFRAEEPFACARGDRFVVRSYSPMVTIGGGIVLDSASERHKRMDPAVVAALQAKERGTPEDLIETWLKSAALGGIQKEIVRAAGVSESDGAAAVASLVEGEEVVRLDADRLIHRGNLASARDRILSSLEAFHAANRLRPGMPKEELRGALGRNVDPKAFAALLGYLQSEGEVQMDPATVRRAGFSVQLDPKQQAVMDRLAELFRRSGYSTPSVEDAAELVGALPEQVSVLLRVGQDQGSIVRIAEGLYFHRDTVEEAKRIVREQVEREGAITVSQFRDITDSSRKYALPLMEYFDTIRFTRRLGDTRVLVEAT